MPKKSTHDILDNDISAVFEEEITFKGHTGKRYQLAAVAPALQGSVPAGVNPVYPFDKQTTVGAKGCIVHVLKSTDIKPGPHAYHIGPQPTDIRSITVP